MKDVIGVKTGYTREAGRCLVSCAERGESRFIAVTLGAPDDWDDHTRLLTAALDGYETVTLVPQGCRIDIGNRIYVTESGLAVTLPKGAADDKTLCYSVTGTKGGEASIICRIGKDTIGSVHAAFSSGDA